MNHKELVQKSIEAKSFTHSLASKFPVGAALLTTKGVFLGANIENASYSLCMCAERTAIYSAHMQGCKKGDYISIAITADTEKHIVPCGACLQVMSEFLEPDAEVILSNIDGDFKVFKFGDIMPLRFSFDDLNN
jgi:cytidine deaminase